MLRSTPAHDAGHALTICSVGADAAATPFTVTAEAGKKLDVGKCAQVEALRVVGSEWEVGVPS